VRQGEDWEDHARAPLCAGTATGSSIARIPSPGFILDGVGGTLGLHACNFNSVVSHSRAESVKWTTVLKRFILPAEFDIEIEETLHEVTPASRTSSTRWRHDFFCPGLALPA
jgi:hypothetical protein